MNIRISLSVNGEFVRAARAPSTRPPRSAARGPRSHRHQARLRARGVRHLHRARRRRAGAVVHRAAGRLQEREITTVEGMADGARLHPLQQAFAELGAAQCGYCTPGILLTAKALLADDPAPTRQRIREALAGNLCRCTGYTKILDAVELARSGVGPARGDLPTVGRRSPAEAPRRQI